MTLEARAQSEIIYKEKVFSFSDLARYYFPEGSYPGSAQMNERLQLVGRVLRDVWQESEGAPKGANPNPISFQMSIDSLLPLIYGKSVDRSMAESSEVSHFQTLDSRGIEFAQAMKMASGPTFAIHATCETEFLRKLMGEKLEKAGNVKKADPNKYHLKKDDEVYEMSDLITVSCLGDGKGATAQKVPLLIFEKGESVFQAPHFTLRVAIDTESDDPKIKEYSPIRDLMKFVFYQSHSPVVDKAINWNASMAAVQFGHEPEIRVSGDHLKILHEPLSFQHIYVTSDVAKRNYKSGPAFTRTFPGKTEYYSSFHAFIQAKAIAKFLSEAVVFGDNFQNGDPSISAKDFVEYQSFSIKALSWMGIDFWPEMDEIAFQMASAAKSNPETFWKYFDKWGLEAFFPAGKTFRANDSPEAFSLLPHLSISADHRPGHIAEQSDEYRMKSCLDLALYAKEIGEEPFSALIVIDGKIVSAAHNEIKKHNDDPRWHGEYISILRAMEIMNKTIENATLYTIASPCDYCSAYIRLHPGVTRVVIGARSGMAGQSLQSTSLEEQGEPYGPAPAVDYTDNLGLQMNFYQLYVEEMGWKKQFADLARNFSPEVKAILERSDLIPIYFNPSKEEYEGISGRESVPVNDPRSLTWWMIVPEATLEIGSQEELDDGVIQKEWKEKILPIFIDPPMVRIESRRKDPDSTPSLQITIAKNLPAVMDGYVMGYFKDDGSWYPLHLRTQIEKIVEGCHLKIGPNLRQRLDSIYPYKYTPNVRGW